MADAGARIAIIESAFLEQFLEARKGLPDLEHVILLDGDDVPNTLRLADIEARSSDFDPEAA